VQDRASVIHEHAVDPFLAKLTLKRLQGRTRDAFGAAIAALLMAAGALAFGEYRLAVPAAAGAVAGFFVGLVARADQVALVHRLVHQRSAYEIPEVWTAAQALVTPAARARLAAGLGRMILEADGFEPANPVFSAAYARIREHRDEFVAVAFHLARPESRVHPTAVALLARLLTRSPVSPLYNSALPSGQVRVALVRVQTSIDA
jgi:hypothetical protein